MGTPSLIYAGYYSMYYNVDYRENSREPTMILCDGTPQPQPRLSQVVHTPRNGININEYQIYIYK